MRADKRDDMHEKMADEEVRKVLQALRDNGLQQAATLLGAHIAALTAERGKWEARSDELAKESDALRERVTALEADLEHSRKATGRGLAEAREKAAAADRAVEVWRTECREAESRLAAIRQRAEGIQRPGVAASVAGTTTGAAQDVARYILGDDAPKAWSLCAEPGCGNTKAAHHAFSSCPEFRPASELDGLEDEPSPNTPATVAAARNAAGNPTEPTTSEAFATLREALGVSIGGVAHRIDGKADSALALVARRMGAAEARAAALGTAALRLIRDAERYDPMPETTDEHGERMVRVQWVLVEALRLLTEAPPVFTLEEVERVLSEAQDVVDGDVCLKTWCEEEVMRRLAALRR